MKNVTLHYISERVRNLASRVIVRRGARRKTSDFSSIYPTWELAKKKSDGWDSSCIIEKVRSAVIAVLSGNFEYERDGTTFLEKPQVNTLRRFLASLATSGSWIIDFGGGLGGTYINNRDILPSDIIYDVIEQPSFCREGEFLAQQFGLPFRFSESLEEVGRHGACPDVVIFSGVLSYVESWEQVLLSTLSLNPIHIIVDRQILTTDNEYICVQKVRNYYDRDISYPLRVFNLDQFIAKFHGYTLTERWPSDFDPPNHHGFHFVRTDCLIGEAF